ncbi:hypothetical protein J2X97_000735 [Epilithonimonas hungarica]|uniref:hypothetical protein n=1 Tax=Epilithonimonas hungarica TaxID=454006 RepID=UPI0027811D09|nr:hypothetical protein [Epilithonimonas hungarica]MDP9955098.1 hypothetical protein [Epilithonimonas hungarica]
MQILFIHGRAQEEFSQEILLEIWSKALSSSFENAKISFPENLQLKLPYYGKDLIQQRDLYKEAFKSGKIKMRSANNESQLDEVYHKILEDLRINAGITKKEVAEEAGETEQYRGLMNNKHAIALARLLDKRLDAVSNFCVKWKTDDVATYLVSDNARKEINDLHISSLTEEPTILIAHSLGTVIAYDILHTLVEEKYDIRGLITLGSPLGVNAVKRQLYPAPAYPPSLKGPWVNIYDPKDIVALNPLDNKNFRVTPKIENREIENDSENRHDITPYLSNPIVAETIHNIFKSGDR